MDTKIRTRLALNLILNATEDSAKERKDEVLLRAVEVIRESYLWLESDGEFLDLING